MCGIAGLFVHDGPVDVRSLARMSRALVHRGPDSEGVWRDDTASIGLVHRRLSIVDLSEAGHQPMHSKDNRWVISYNGEIYNAATLKQRLEAREAILWTGHSDTEIMLEAIAQWGVARALELAEGMLAFAAWDRRNRKLYLARDRMGEKPLYVSFLSNGVAFASELKAFHGLRGFQSSLHPEAIRQYFVHGYIPSPLSIYRTTFKLPPGSWICLDQHSMRHIGTVSEFQQACVTYWSAADLAAQSTPKLAADESIEALKHAFEASVSNRMLADVPVGAFLSGGIDSSLVAAVMQQKSSHRVKTFTIGFSEKAFDESVQAERVARYLGSDHQTVRFSPEQALDLLPRSIEVYDEPFADTSQLPTMLLASVTRPHVTVSLSGDGADELFGGYPRYWNAMRHMRTYQRWPVALRRSIGRLATTLFVHPGFAAARRIDRVATAMQQLDAAGVHDCLSSVWVRPQADILAGNTSFPGAVMNNSSLSGNLGASHMLLSDQLRYLPDDLMVKTDRASMAVSLEVRMPFLSPSMVELSWRIPFHDKIQGSLGKLPLRRLLRTYLPDDLIKLPKRGFNVPIAQWLRGPLRGWAEQMLDATTIKSGGYLNERAARAIWSRHLAGKDESQALWTILCFQFWLGHTSASAP
jgi:asparagine synthase (glutamine-hydrolysing)